MSAVRTFPALITSNVAEAMLLAIGSRLRVNQVNANQDEANETNPKCRSIIVALRIMAAGLALLVPMISLAT